MPQEQILQSWLDKVTSGLNLSDVQYVAFRQWQKGQIPGSFEDEIIRKEWEHSNKRLPLEKYKASKFQALEDRWEKTGLKQAGLDFKTWRKMQDPSLINDTGTREFIHCDAQTRKLFQLSTTDSGIMLRNNQPYSTEYETTLHSGKGYAIFVIGSDEKIYAASHIQQVFHHSSFLANAAVLAAGELRMGMECLIQHAKNQQEADIILEQFRTTNKDAYKILFVQNEANDRWQLAGKNATGDIQIIGIAASSDLDQALQDSNRNDLSFSERSTILNQAATLLGRINPTNKVTLLSSKSGHYQPRDEENYYMLKLWEKHGVDLAKTPFTSLSSSQLYENAQEYLDKIESTHIENTNSTALVTPETTSQEPAAILARYKSDIIEQKAASQPEQSDMNDNEKQVSPNR